MSVRGFKLSLFIHCQVGRFLFFNLHIICVMVPMGQYTHQLLGLYKTMVIRPKIVEVSITL